MTPEYWNEVNSLILAITVMISFIVGVDIVTGKQIGRASCRERV